MKRLFKIQASQVTPASRSLRIESLEDRKLMTVATEMVHMPQQAQIGSEHWPEPAAEIAVEKFTNGRKGFFARGLHNNGAFQDPAGHILWNAKDTPATPVESYTDSGRVPYFANHLKNVQVSSIAAPSQFSHHANVDKLLGETQLGGQESEAFQANPISLNFEEIQVSHVQNDHAEKTLDRSNGIVGGTMCSARSANDPVFFSHHANVDKVFSNHLLGGQESEPVVAESFSLNFEEIKLKWASGGQDEQDLPILGDEDERGVADPRYTEDEQGGPADPLNDPRMGTGDQDEESDAPSEEEMREVVERVIEVLDIL